MITGAIVGGKELIERIGAMPRAVKAEVDATVNKLGFRLQALVQTTKLTGQVLRVRTGRLRSSIARGDPDSRSRFEATPTTATAIVGTNVSYGVDWERGIAAHDVVPVHAKALRFEVGGQVLFRKKVHIPAQAPRQFLEPALQDIRPEAERELAAALKRGAQEALS
jgi:hypothetical protein